MNITDLSWAAFSKAFGDACSLIDKKGDKVRILAALEQAREALNDVLDDIPASTSNVQVNIARRSAINLREHVDAIWQEVTATRQ